MNENEVKRLVDVLRQRFPTVAPLLDEVVPPAINVIKCVLSLNRRYDSMVAPRVQRFAHNHPDIQELAQLRVLIMRYDSLLAFSTVELDYRDPRRPVNPRAGQRHLGGRRGSVGRRGRNQEFVN
jgi:hypothetical protein